MDIRRLMLSAGFPSFFGLGLEDCHVPTFWLLLLGAAKADYQGLLGLIGLPRLLLRGPLGTLDMRGPGSFLGSCWVLCFSRAMPKPFD